MFDGTGHPPGPGDVVIEDGRVVDIGSGLDGGEQVDCSGRTILPGLFDTHVHFMISGIDMWGMLQTPLSYRFFQAARNLEATLDAGITTARDAGGADAGLRKAVDEGLIPGPRMQVSIGMLSQTGGHGDAWLASGVTAPLFPAWPGSPETIVDGPDEVRRKVRELIRCGADVIKVATSGGVLSASDEPTHAHLSPAELDVLMEEANAAGRFVMAHAQATTGMRERDPRRDQVDRARHLSRRRGDRVDGGAWDMAGPNPFGAPRCDRRGGAGCPGARQRSSQGDRGDRDPPRLICPSGFRRGEGGYGDRHRSHTPWAQSCGAELDGAGRDVANRCARCHHPQRRRLMGLDRELGTLQPGKRADLVVVDGDPLDLEALPGAIVEVWKDGVRVKG